MIALRSALAALAAAAALGGRAAAQQATYAVEWTAVADLADQTASEDPARRGEFGSCVCDVTHLECDFNCRCDTDDCSEDQIKLFTSSDPEGPRDLSVRRCVDAELIEANERGGLTTTLVDDLLCIEKVNNDERTYFTDPGTPTAAEVSDAVTAAAARSFSPAPAAESDARDHYKVDDAVGGGAFAGGAIQHANGGLMPLPAPGFAGECTDRAAPLFLRDVAAGAGARCTRYVASLENECDTAFSLDAYVASLRVKRSPSSVPDDAAGWVAPNVARVVRRDAATGAEAAVAAAAVLNSYDVALGACVDALVELHYDVTYAVKDDSEGGGLVTAVAVTAVVTNVAGSGAARHQQQFTVSYAPASPNAAERPKSGNPGYRTGAPVLAGSLVSDGGDKSAVAQLVGGLQVLPHLPGGTCTSEAAATLRHTVGFGTNAVFSCSLDLTLGQLVAECADPALLRALFTAAFDRVGAFGNADFTVVPDWVEVAGLDPSDVSTAYSSATRRCTVTNALNLRFITADVGAQNNPQRRIVAARADLGSTGAWEFPRADGSGTASFPVTVTATFVHMEDQALEAYTPSAPPVLPRLPRDVLYPLYIAD